MFNFSTVHRNAHVIGFPFAGGQEKPGPELSPLWLVEQPWFKEMERKGGVTSEIVKVTSPKCNAA